MLGIGVFFGFNDRDSQNDDIINNDSTLNSEENIDAISGYSWKTNDEMYLYLYPDNSFLWFQDSSNLDDNYYYGTYEVYKGESAIDYVSEIVIDNGATQDEQYQLIEEFSENIKGNPKNYYYVLVLNNEYLIKDMDVSNVSTTTVYTGMFYETTKYLSFINMDNQGLTRMDKLSGSATLSGNDIVSD